MSTTRYARNGLQIDTFAGPAENVFSATGSRIMVQLTTERGSVALTMDQWVDLVSWLRVLDMQYTGITSAPEVDT
jgi:hypothetical protein